MVAVEKEEARNFDKEGIMKNREEIKKDILAALGNPSVGVFVDHIETILDAVVGERAKAPEKSGSVQGENKAAPKPAQETRVIEATEKR